MSPPYEFLKTQGRLYSLLIELKRKAVPIGTMCPLWDVIADIECFLKGEPTILKYTEQEWIDCAEECLKRYEGK